MDADDVQRAVWRMAHEIIEANQGIDEILLIGLQTGGVAMADALANALNTIAHVEVPVGTRVRPVRAGRPGADCGAGAPTWCGSG